jgi:hypothetical protein
MAINKNYNLGDTQMFKKTAIAALVLGFSGVASAAMIAPTCTAGGVTVPCERNAWDLGLTGLYLKQTSGYDGSYYGNIVVAGTPDHTTYQDIDYDSAWAFRLDGSYHFGTGKDFTVNWTRYSDKFDNSYLINATQTDAFWSDTKFDAVNFELAQMVDMGEMTNVRFHGGFQYARIEQDVKNSVFDTATGNNLTVTTSASKFSGFGVRTGMDMTHDFGNGFGVLFNGAASLLAGKNEMNTGGWTQYTTTDPIVLTATGSAEHKQVVAALDARAGVKYTHAMDQGDLTLEGGYQLMNYFNVMNNVGADSDFGLYGPYIGAKWVGNA